MRRIVLVALTQEKGRTRSVARPACHNKKSEATEAKQGPLVSSREGRSRPSRGIDLVIGGSASPRCTPRGLPNIHLMDLMSELATFSRDLLTREAAERPAC